MWHLPWREFILKRTRYKDKKKQTQTPKHQTIPQTPPPLLTPPSPKRSTWSQIPESFKCKHPHLWGCRLHRNTLRHYKTFHSCTDWNHILCMLSFLLWLSWLNLQCWKVQVDLWCEEDVLVLLEAGCFLAFPQLQVSDTVSGVLLLLFSQICVCLCSWNDSAEGSAPWCAAGSAGDGVAQGWAELWERTAGMVSLHVWGLQEGSLPRAGHSVCGVQAAVPHQHQSESQALRNPAPGTSHARGCGCCREIHQWDTEMIHQKEVLMGPTLFFTSCESVCEVSERQTQTVPTVHPHIGRGKKISLWSSKSDGSTICLTKWCFKKQGAVGWWRNSLAWLAVLPEQGCCSSVVFGTRSSVLKSRQAVVARSWPQE